MRLKNIIDFESYAITPSGKVWSYKSKKFLKSSSNKKGYLIICLCKNGKRHTKKIHRLVLETFVGPCPEGMECRHLDGNKLNNQLSNLCWGTSEENKLDKIKHGTECHGEARSCSKLKEQQVRQLIYLCKTKCISKTKIAELYNISRETLYGILNRKYWRYLWA